MREDIHALHRHAEDVVAVGAIAGAGAGAAVTAGLGPDPCLDLPGHAESLKDQGVLVTAGVPGDPSPQQQMKRSAAPPLMVAVVQGVHRTR